MTPAAAMRDADVRLLDRLCTALGLRAPPAGGSPAAAAVSADAVVPSPAPAATPYAVAFSGGLDSTVLLAAMTRVAAGVPLRALHVDHGLHADSAAWERHCRDVAAGLGVGYDSVRVEVDRRSGRGLEAAAREARYAAFAELLGDGEVLLTAHHADDQLETLLLRLLRGTGVRGLRGILPHAPLGRGAVVRPLLDVARDDIRAFAEHAGLGWLEDPSNLSLDHDRNYLRRRVLPLVQQRFGAAAASAGRAAAAMADAEEILTTVGAGDLGAAAAPGRVPLDALRSLGAPRRRNALRHAIRAAGLPTPTARQLEELCAALAVRRADAKTRVQWPGGEACVYRDTLYLLAPVPPAPAAPAQRGYVGASRPWSGPEGDVTLTPGDRAEPAALPESWALEGLEVRFRSGGERFRPAGDAHSRSLKHWFQQQGIVPWMRDRIPLLFRDGSLVAVADLAVDERARQAAANERVWQVRWSGHAPLS